MYTFAVISCNRLHYLRNCVESIFEFAGDFLDSGAVDLLVIDNASTEPGLHEYLRTLPSRVTVHRFDDRATNELYRAMNFAIDFSRRRSRDYVHFIQDDCQFLRRDPTLLSRVAAAFDARPDVYQLHASLAWKMKLWKWENQGTTQLVEVPDPASATPRRWLHLGDRTPCDTGFTRVSLFDRIGLFPDHVSLKGSYAGEEWLYARCREINAARMYSLNPVMGMLFDAAYVRGPRRIGRYFPPPARFYIKPLTQQQIHAIDTNAAAGRLSCIEDFQIADGWTPRTMLIRSEEGSSSLDASMPSSS